MPPTKRKRRTKHRGNAAGMVEARGRTGRKLTPEEQKKAGAKGGGRDARPLRAPSWNNAIMRAGFAALLLLVLMQVIGLGPNVTLGSKIALCAFAFLIYVPLGYATDRWVYNRRMRAEENKAKR
jgi:hypothetical protein